MGKNKRHTAFEAFIIWLRFTFMFVICLFILSSDMKKARSQMEDIGNGTYYNDGTGSYYNSLDDSNLPKLWTKHAFTSTTEIKEYEDNTGNSMTYSDAVYIDDIGTKDISKSNVNMSSNATYYLAESCASDCISQVKVRNLNKQTCFVYDEKKNATFTEKGIFYINTFYSFITTQPSIEASLKVDLRCYNPDEDFIMTISGARHTFSEVKWTLGIPDYIYIEPVWTFNSYLGYTTLDYDNVTYLYANITANTSIKVKVYANTNISWANLSDKYPYNDVRRSTVNPLDDNSGNGNNLTNINTLYNNTNNWYELNSTGYLNLTNSSKFSMNTTNYNFTICLDAKVNDNFAGDAAGKRFLFAKGKNNNYEYEIDRMNSSFGSNIQFIVWNLSGNTICSLRFTSYTVGIWSNYCAVVNTTHCLTYVNGALTNSTAMTIRSGMRPGISETLIGARALTVSNPTINFNGSIDNIGVWNTSLNATEISNRYNNISVRPNCKVADYYFSNVSASTVYNVNNLSMAVQAGENITVTNYTYYPTTTVCSCPFPNDHTLDFYINTSCVCSVQNISYCKNLWVGGTLWINGTLNVSDLSVNSTGIIYINSTGTIYKNRTG